MSRMNGQLDVTGARRHVYDEWDVGVNFRIAKGTAWWQWERWLFQTRKKENKNINETGWETKRVFFWFMSHHYNSEAINQI
jgi:hypothetical protein